MVNGQLPPAKTTILPARIRCPSTYVKLYKLMYGDLVVTIFTGLWPLCPLRHEPRSTITRVCFFSDEVIRMYQVLTL